MSSAKRKVLDEDVFLYTTVTENPKTFIYEVECAKFKNLDFTIDFSGSKNLRLESGGGLVSETTVRPYQRTRVAVAKIADPRSGTSIKVSSRWLIREPDAELIEQMVVEDREKMTRELAMVI